MMKNVKLDISKSGIEITADMKEKALAANALLHSGKGAGNDFLGWVHLPSSISAEEIRAQVRPWLQDFTATWVNGHISYGPEEIRAQIQGVYDAGYEEWILWNAANRYTEGGLLAEEEGA